MVSTEAEEVAPALIYAPYTESLREEVRLYSDGTPESEDRAKQAFNVLTSDDYNEIEKRMRGWFGDDD